MLYPEVVLRHLARLAQAYRIEVPDDLSSVLISGFALPPGWQPPMTAILMKLPPDYPLMPPGLTPGYGLHLPFALRYQGRRVADFHEHGEVGGWSWWCYSHLAWDPRADDVFTILERLRLDLSNPRLI